MEIGDELWGIDLGDRRLNERAVKLLETLSRQPMVSINAACGGLAETTAAYRFFDNDKVTAENILEPHVAATVERMRGHSVVLMIQDTTELDFSAHPPEGAGPLRSWQTRGYLDHTTLAVTPERLALGVVDVQMLARTEAGFGQSRSRSKDPFETKELFRWLEGYRVAARLQALVPDTQLISVADREGDLYEVLVETRDALQKVEFVIRSNKDRRLPERDPEAAGNTWIKLHDRLAESSVRAAQTIDLPRTSKRAARTAVVEVRADTFTLKPPQTKSKLGTVTVNVIEVRETNPPADGTAVHWILLTSLPITSVAEILLAVDYYTARWTIESYFRVLKSGCTIEDLQLETTPRVQRCLMLYRIIAWRVMHLTYLGRECPELPCDVVFADHEWQPVWQIVKQSPPPKTPPPLAEFVRTLATLGGYNHRKHDGPPGPQTLWLALRRMTDFSLAWLTFHQKVV